MDGREQPRERHRAGLGDHVLLGDPALDEALGKALAKRDEARVEIEIGVERHEPGLLLGGVDECLAVGGDEPLRGRRRRVDGPLLGGELGRRGAQIREAAGQALEQLRQGPVVVVRARRARVERVERVARARKTVRLHERHARALARVRDQQLRPIPGVAA